MVIENAGGIGVSIIDKLRNQFNYPNLYRYLPPVNARRKRAAVFGFPTTKATKPLVINRLAEYIAEGEDGQPRLVNLYKELREELATYVRRENGTTAADVGCHDDLVMSLAIGLYVLLEEILPVGGPPIGETLQPGEFQIDMSEIYREAEMIQRYEAKANRKFWSQHKRQTRRYRRSRGL
jgi:hypothetical protein